MESIQQHLCITGVRLMTLLGGWTEGSDRMAFSELHKHWLFVNSFSAPLPSSSCLFFPPFLARRVEIKIHSGRNCHVSGRIVWTELRWLILRALGAMWYAPGGGWRAEWVCEGHHVAAWTSWLTLLPSLVHTTLTFILFLFWYSTWANSKLKCLWIMKTLSGEFSSKGWCQLHAWWLTQSSLDDPDLRFQRHLRRHFTIAVTSLDAPSYAINSLSFIEMIEKGFKTINQKTYMV